MKYLAEQILDQLNELSVLNKDIRQAEEMQQKTEDSLYMNVLSAKDENGKAMYSNETVRQITVRQMLSKDLEYIVQNKYLLELKTKLDVLKANIEFSRKNYEIQKLEREEKIFLIKGAD